MRYRWLAIAVLMTLSTVARLDAQQIWRVDGRVQWIAGAKMLLIPQEGGSPVNIDLSRVPLEQYTGLRESDLVRVNGVFSTEGRRLVATAVQPFPIVEERVDGQDVAIPTPAPPAASLPAIRR